MAPPCFCACELRAATSPSIGSQGVSRTCLWLWRGFQMTARFVTGRQAVICLKVTTLQRAHLCFRLAVWPYLTSLNHCSHVKCGKKYPLLRDVVKIKRTRDVECSAQCLCSGKHSRCVCFCCDFAILQQSKKSLEYCKHCFSPCPGKSFKWHGSFWYITSSLLWSHSQKHWQTSLRKR